MTSLIVGVLLIAAESEVPPPPAAMVLAAKGSVVVVRGGKEKPATEMDLLRAGDVVRVATGGLAKVVVLGDGHREEIPAGAEVKLAAEGCQPADAVKREPAKIAPGQLANLRKMALSQRGGVVVIRSGNAIPPGLTKRSPLNGTTVLTVKPSFRWAEVPEVLGYRIELIRDTPGKPRRTVWTAESREPSLEYPADAKALEAGERYHWVVTSLLGGDKEQVAVNARFVAPTEETAAEVKELKSLAESPDPAEWLLAATTLEASGAYEAALPLFEKLAEKAPGSARYQEILAEYYERAGEAEKAKAAVEKAKRLSE